MMSLAACVSRWPSTTRWPWLVECALAQERLEHRRLRLLELEEQRIALVAAEHEHDPGARADAAHADDLARRVDVAVALEQPPAVGGQGAPVGADALPGRTPRAPPRSAPDATSSIGTMSGGSLTILRSPSTTSVSFANAFRLSFDCAFATLRSNRLTLLAGRLLGGQRGDVVDVDAGVPQVEVGHRGEAPDRLAVGPRHRPIDRPAAASRRSPDRGRQRRSWPPAASRPTRTGRGSVSSKSLMLNTSRRSGAANAPKFERCASPQSCTSSPVRGTPARSAAIG